MTEKQFTSPSGKYQTSISKDVDGEQSHWEIMDSNGTTKQPKCKYLNVIISRVSDNELIYKYKQENSFNTFNGFVTVGDQEWWLGGRNYLLKMFVNCTTGKAYDDPGKRGESEAYKYGTEWIWVNKPDPEVLFDRFLRVKAIVWGISVDDWLYYDLKKLEEGEIFENVEPSDYFVEDPDDWDSRDERLGFDVWDDQDEMFFESSPDNPNEIKIYYNLSDGVKKYYNTMDFDKKIE